MRASELVTEAPMNPGEYNKAIDTGHSKGVLVGFEFEVCMPRATVVDFKKNHPKPHVTTQWVDNKLKTDSDLLNDQDFESLSPQDFIKIFKLKPGVTKYNSTEEMLNSVIQDKIRQAKEQFNKIPKPVRARAMSQLRSEDKVDEMTFMRQLGRHLYYNYDGIQGRQYPGGSREIEQIGGELRALGNLGWWVVFEEVLPDANLSHYGDSKFSDFFDFDPAQVCEVLEIRTDDPVHGAFQVIKPALEQKMGAKVTIFNKYHQSTKNMTDWYIEPDGSLRPDNRDDFTAEVVSPPMPSKDAVLALKNFFGIAADLKLYTNSTTGLHINVSIPEKIDLLKLAVFTGDQYILNKYNRLNSDYAQSVTRSIPGQISNREPVVTVQYGADKNIFGRQKQTTRIDTVELQDIASRVTHDHMASVSSNGRWVSFRHVGGNYLKDYTEIYNVVGRFVRAVIIASDPSLYKNEYQAAIAKMTRAVDKTGVNNSAIPYIKKAGLPVIELDIANLDSDHAARGKQTIDEVLKYEGLDPRLYIVDTTLGDSELRALFLHAAEGDRQFIKKINRANPAAFAKCFIYPKDAAGIKAAVDFYARNYMRSLNWSDVFFISKKFTIPAGDPRLRPYFLQLRKQK